MIQVYRPVREIEEITGSTVTSIRLEDGRVHCNVRHKGMPATFPPEESSQALAPLRVTGATLTAIRFDEGDGNVYYTLGKIEQAYTPGGMLEREWFNRDGFVRTLTGVRLSGDEVDYEVLDGDQPGILHETGASVLSRLRISGVRIVGAEFKNGTVYYMLAEA